ncbi:MAG: OmpA family protein [Deltaproteobacteria bacterium]|nr:OmpA family protein [Deltaproteobacteria bacterium]
MTTKREANVFKTPAPVRRRSLHVPRPVVDARPRSRVVGPVSSFRRGGGLAGALLVCALVHAPVAAGADDTISEGNGDGMALRLFRPAVDSKGMFTINASPILGHMDLSFGLVLDGGLGILPVAGDDGTNFVEGLYSGVFSFNLGLFNAAVVGVQLPVIIGQGEFEGSIAGLDSSGSGENTKTLLDLQDLGDVTLHTKFRLLRVERNPIGLAAVLQIGFPTGNSRSFAAEPGFSIWPMLVLDVEPTRRFRASLNAGYRLVTGEGSIVGAGDQEIEYGSQLTLGAGLSYQLVLGTLDLVAESYANTLQTDMFKPRATPVEAIGGLKVFVERNSYLYLGGGIGVTNGFSAADQRLFLAFIFEPSIGDRDGDGIKDDVDRCINDPEDFDQFEDEDGCPEPDNDRDGILDVDDECPLIPEDRDGEEDEDGCPEGNEGDRDGDGILDNVDQCPDEPEDRDNFEDEEGCPDPDNDQDGILDPDDLCPNDPEDRDNFEDTDGCPDPDNDNDRILDVDDQCPNDPETYNGEADEDGCPDQGRVQIEENQIVILDKIYFETDSAVIQERSFPIIEAVAATLQGNPQIRMIEIQGHADERSDDAYNIRLTRDRAAAVLEALVQRSVLRTRVRSAGYGERCPVDPRHNAAAWEKNRRVEFKILETDAGPTGVEVACPAGRELIPR